MSEGEVRKCEVCRTRPFIGVGSSSLGPVSVAVCQVCLAQGYEPMWVIISALMGVTSFDGVTDEAAKVMRDSIAFHEVTEEQLWQQVKEFTADYAKHAMEELR